MGPGEFPVNAAVKFPSLGYISTTRYVWERAVAASKELPELKGADVKILTNHAARLGVADLPYDVIPHLDGRAGTALCNYLGTYGYDRVVRLLGNHTLTDMGLVAETILRFNELPADKQRNQRFGPNVCDMGQNIEVMAAGALLHGRQVVLRQVPDTYDVLKTFPDPTPQGRDAYFEEHITPVVPAAKEALEVMSPLLRVDYVMRKFSPFISPLPGYAQRQTTANVSKILGVMQQERLPVTFANVRKLWLSLDCKMDQYHWSEKGFQPKTFADVRAAIARGVTTVEGPAE